MDKQMIISEVSEAVSACIREQGFELVDIIHRYEGKDLFLRILVDRPQGGITMEECAVLNTQIGLILDEKDILQRRYILEVSSPGLDRPLKSKADFMRCLNRSARFFLKEPVEGKIEIAGKLINVSEEDMIEVRTKDKDICIPLEKINKAKQIIEDI
ncbi:MAG: ribosome maturation factor RimP [Candidatus Omnitrophota bacterium]|nr:MAG: ribosome maturation factor RimP [Candidatus Omnitrophota bacterium]